MVCPAKFLMPLKLKWVVCVTKIVGTALYLASIDGLSSI
jgi:hypothetical protein